MKTVKALLIIMTCSFLSNGNAQEAKASNDDQVETKHSLSYYQQRGIEDAQYEQDFQAKNKVEENTFWKEQQQYEKELKRNNRRAHNAYLRGKREGYAAHYDHCDSHCHHSNYWYQHADYYYYEYRQPRYENRPSKTTVNTGIGVGAPSIRLGLF